MIQWVRDSLENYRARKAALKLELSDEGRVTGYYYYLEKGNDDGLLARRVCMTCKSRARVGISGNGKKYRYCWKCQKILSKFFDEPNAAFLEIVFKDESYRTVKKLQEKCCFKDVVGVMQYALNLLKFIIDKTRSGGNVGISAKVADRESEGIEWISLGHWEYVVDEGWRLKREKDE